LSELSRERTPNDLTLHDYARRHVRLGWVALLVFASLGIVLEALHAFKVGVYLDVGQETRRWLWTLAHAHGIGLGLLHVAFAWTVQTVVADVSRSLRWASWLLTSASVLIPAGFFLGGLGTYGSDPGLGIALLPVGAAALWLALLLTCFVLRGPDRS